MVRAVKEATEMFSAWCPIQQTVFLHSPSEIVRIVEAERGMDVVYRCVCGEEHMFASGRPRRAATEVLDRCA